RDRRRGPGPRRTSAGGGATAVRQVRRVRKALWSLPLSHSKQDLFGHADSGGTAARRAGVATPHTLEPESSPAQSDLCGNICIRASTIRRAAPRRRIGTTPIAVAAAIAMEGAAPQSAARLHYLGAVSGQPAAP